MARQEPGTGRYSRWSAGNPGFEDDTIGPVEGGLGWYLAGQLSRAEAVLVEEGIRDPTEPPMMLSDQDDAARSIAPCLPTSLAVTECPWWCRVESELVGRQMWIGVDVGLAEVINGGIGQQEMIRR